MSISRVPWCLRWVGTEVLGEVTLRPKSRRQLRTVRYAVLNWRWPSCHFGERSSVERSTLLFACCLVMWNNYLLCRISTVIVVILLQTKADKRELHRRIAVHIVTACQTLFEHYLYKAESWYIYCIIMQILFTRTHLKAYYLHRVLSQYQLQIVKH